MNWLEQKYINQISYRLRNFKRKSSHGDLFNFSCPLCNDSTSNKLKARGYIYVKKGVTLFHCHNCGITMTIPKFIKTLDPGMHKQFMLEQMQDKAPPASHVFAAKMKMPVFRKEGILKDLKKVSQLQPNDPVKKLVVGRQIPTNMHHLLFKVDDFMKFTNSLLPGKFSEETVKRADGPRLLIPFFTKDKNCFAYQGRAINNDDPIRYITIVVDESHPKIWGLDRVDPNKTVYVFEGPIDAMFFDNAISTAGGDMVATLASLPIAHEKYIICYDNEKHSKETIAKINKAIDHNFKVFIYPDQFEYKDINEAIMHGYNSSELMAIADQNTYSDLAARLRLTSYKRI